MSTEEPLKVFRKKSEEEVVSQLSHGLRSVLYMIKKHFEETTPEPDRTTGEYMLYALNIVSLATYHVFSLAAEATPASNRQLINDYVAQLKEGLEKELKLTNQPEEDQE